MRKRLLSGFWFLLLALALVLPATGAAASASQGTPAAAPPPPPGPIGLTAAAQPLSAVQVIALPEQDNAALVQQEMERRQPGTPARFAQPVAVDLAPAASGTWELLRGGAWLWRLRIVSPKAVSLNLGFTRYRMPAGGQLWLYTPDGRVVVGPFTEADNESHGQLWTPIVPGEEVVVEVQLPPAATPSLDLVLGQVNHGFADMGAPLSGSCNVDVVCGAADGYPQVDAWRDQIRSVGAYTVGGVDFCSGALINNTAQDRTPYFLTANHCLTTQAEAATVVVYWNYQNSYCRPPGSAASGRPGDGQRSQYNAGADLVATYGGSDFTLLRLDDPINPLLDLYWSGYDARDQATSLAVTIHHPQVEEKRISFENHPTTITTYLASTPNPRASHLRITDWDLGTTEPGSSGSPLFSPQNRIVGQLHGGYATCDNNSSDWYGRLATSWEGGGTSSSRLRDWLDPQGGTTLVLDGRVEVVDFALEVTPAQSQVCLPGSAAYWVEIDAAPGFGEPVALGVTGLPAGAQATFNPNPVSPPGSSALRIDSAATAAPGNYTLQIEAVAATGAHTATVSMALFDAMPGLATPLSPANGEINVAYQPVFQWQAAAQGGSYTLEMARDPGFTDPVTSVSGLTGTSYALPMALEPAEQYYWRVRASNPCAEGAPSAAYRFITRGLPGQCGPGQGALVLLSEDFENGAAGWSHDGLGDTWQLSQARVHAGQYAYQATNPSAISDQRLTSPAVSLPEERAPLTLQFWNYQHMEDRSGGCFDGGLLEISIDDGATWAQVESGLLTDPYDGMVSNLHENPLADQDAWCGDPQDWLNSVVELDDYAGQTVRFRFRLGTDRSIGREGWAIDDVLVQACQATVTGPRFYLPLILR